MPGTFQLHIVTPEKVSWEGTVESLVLPARDGLMGILPGHAPLLAELAPGVVQIRTAAEEKALAVSGGFVEVINNKVSLFAETAELSDEINEERARQAAERAKTALRSGPQDDTSAVESEAAMLRALTRLKAVEWARRRRSASPRA